MRISRAHSAPPIRGPPTRPSHSQAYCCNRECSSEWLKACCGGSATATTYRSPLEGCASAQPQRCMSITLHTLLRRRRRAAQGAPRSTIRLTACDLQGRVALIRVIHSWFSPPRQPTGPPGVVPAAARQPRCTQSFKRKRLSLPLNMLLPSYHSQLPPH